MHRVLAPPKGDSQMNFRIRQVGATLPAAIAIVALAGCSAPFAQASPSSSPDPRQAMLRFSQCMRQHGINLPDPNGDGAITIKGDSGSAGSGAGLSSDFGDPNSPTFKAAQTACQKYMPSGGPKNMTSQDIKKNLEKGLKFSQCMRQHGLPDFPDPQSNSGGGSTFSQAAPGGKPPGGSAGGALSINGQTFTFDPSSPAFQKAQQACSSILGIKGGLPSGPPPASGGN
jgi:hypothetical protein